MSLRLPLYYGNLPYRDLSNLDDVQLCSTLVQVTYS